MNALSRFARRKDGVLGEVAPVATEQTVEATETAGRRRSRRGRRRGRGRDGQEAPVEQALTTAAEVEEEEIITPFVETDPSIQRIVDEEETAAVNGEMFKDARLQERIFDQIHAVEFNFDDDYRNPEVGSVLPSGGFQNASFQRIDDGEDTGDQGRIMMRAPETIAARVNSFVDTVDDQTLPGGTFQRVSDDEDITTPSTIDAEEDEETQAQGFAARAVEKIVGVARRKAGTRKPAASKGKTKAASKKAPAKKRAKSVADDATDRVLMRDILRHWSGRSGSKRYQESLAVNSRRERWKTATTTGFKTKGHCAALTMKFRQMVRTKRKRLRRTLRPVEEAKPAAPVEKPAAPEPAPGAGFSHYPRSQRRDRQQPTITDLLMKGRRFVQIAKELIAKKGACITSHIALLVVFSSTCQRSNMWVSPGKSNQIAKDTGCGS